MFPEKRYIDGGVSGNIKHQINYEANFRHYPEF